MNIWSTAATATALLTVTGRRLTHCICSPDTSRIVPQSSLQYELMGQTYAAPFGVAPVGLSGLIWPGASASQARAARQANIPFVLSSLASISIEQAAELAQENFWFQFYPPTVEEISTDLMARAWNSGCRHLVVTIDVPSAGYRPADIRNGLSVPPKISAINIWQSICRPSWSLATRAPRHTSVCQYAAVYTGGG